MSVNSNNKIQRPDIIMKNPKFFNFDSETYERIRITHLLVFGFIRCRWCFCKTTYFTEWYRAAFAIKCNEIDTQTENFD